VLLAAAAALLTAACASNPPAAGPRPFPNAPVRSWPSATASARAAGAVAFALTQRGVQYQLGGSRPAEGFDCSGLVQYAYAREGIELPRTVKQQYQTGARVDRRDIRPGDLIFFTTETPGPSHVGIAIDAQSFVHAPVSGGVVRVERFTTPYWRSRLTGVRRVSNLRK
jgi:cell wall-associated NlpC family hydrolase